MSYDVVCSISALPISSGDRAVIFSHIPGSPVCDMAAYRKNGIDGPFLRGIYDDAGTLINDAGEEIPFPQDCDPLYVHEMAYDTIVADNTTDGATIHAFVSGIREQAVNHIIEGIKSSRVASVLLGELKLTEHDTLQCRAERILDNAFYGRELITYATNAIWEHNPMMPGNELARFMEKMPGTIGRNLWSALLNPETTPEQLKSVIEPAAFAYGADMIGASFEVRPTLIIESQEKVESLMKATQKIAQRKMHQPDVGGL